jgi:hypothetical protein
MNQTYRLIAPYNEVETAGKAPIRRRFGVSLAVETWGKSRDPVYVLFPEMIGTFCWFDHSEPDPKPNVAFLRWHPNCLCFVRWLAHRLYVCTCKTTILTQLAGNSLESHYYYAVIYASKALKYYEYRTCNCFVIAGLSRWLPSTTTWCKWDTYTESVAWSFWYYHQS